MNTHAPLKEIFHPLEGGDGMTPEDYRRIEACFMSNLEAPVVRFGDAPFKAYYSVEVNYWGFHTIDPSRSLAEMVLKCMRERSDENPWPACDMLYRLLTDIGFVFDRPAVGERIAFWTLFPDVMFDFLSCSYIGNWIPMSSKPGGHILRVLNNPFYYRTENGSEKRLVEIAEHEGIHYALDLIKFMPSPEALANEIAWLNHGWEKPGLVPSVRQALTQPIAEVMSDWGLLPEA